MVLVCFKCISFSYIRDCYTRRQPVNSVFIVFVYCIFINTSHTLLTPRNVEGGPQGMCTEVGLELGLLYTVGDK